MLSFVNDYSEGAHQKILDAFYKTNLVKQPGYENDEYCESAAKRIKEACKTPDADVFFLVGGTQTNSTVIATMLKPFEGVLSAVSGHINVHEAGAVEYTGHKVLPLPSHDGKVCAKELRDYLVTYYADESYDHMVFPGLLYISHPTEYGTLYTLSELKEIRAVLDEYDLPLFIDGARLGYGLMADGTDVTLEDIARISDVFYIGGTKVGALCGEAVVFPKGNSPAHFITQVKQHGAMLAKGRLVGIQFDVLFDGTLYLEISKNAIDKAMKMKAAFASRGYEFYIDSPTNQQFIIVDEEKLKYLSEHVKFEVWERLSDGRYVIRFVTSWATTELEIEELESIL